MLDTAAFSGYWPLTRPISFNKPFSPLPNTHPGMKVCPTYDCKAIRRVECSLPRLLWGNNGRLIENQQQLDDAFRKLEIGLATICHSDGFSNSEVDRIDLCWNYDISAEAVILAHAALLIPWVQTGATLHKGGQGVSWLGTKSLFKLMLYNKSRKERVAGSVLRAEIALRGARLRSVIHGGEWRDFAALWCLYRSFMVQIPPIPSVTSVTRLIEAVGQEPPEIRNRILARLAHRPGRTVRRLKEQCEAAAAKLKKPFSWAEILPVANPPKAVHVERASKRRTDTAGTEGGL